MQPIDRTKYMSQEEVDRLRTVTEAQAVLDLRDGRVAGPLAWMVVDLALSTGLRVSELAKIKVQDIDLKRGFLMVTRSKKREKAKPEPLSIGKELAEHLREYIETVRDGEKWKTDVLLLGKRGALKVQGLELIWNAAIERAGLQKYTIHKARHTIAVHMLRETGNLRMVQKQLGHADPATTANMYADVSHEDMQAALNRLYGKKKDNGKAKE